MQDKKYLFMYQVQAQLRTVSAPEFIELANYLDKLHNFSFDELGIDIAIDENGRYWMHEENSGPQTV